MAGLKKKRKEKSGSPNIVLVVFLVFFILVNITFGILWYYALQDRATARAAADTDKKTKQEAEKQRQHYQMLYDDLRVVLGDKLDKDEEASLTGAKETFVKEDVSSDPKKDAARKLMFDLRAKLGTATDYPARVTAAEEEAKKLAASLTDLTGKIKRMEDFSKDHIKRQDAFYQDVTGRIDTENKNILLQVRVNSDAFKKLTESNQALTAELDEKKGEILKLKDDQETELKRLVREINILKSERKEMANAGAGGPGGGRVGGDVFPLIIDMSMGKPLWDTPVGRVVRVDLDLRQVTINLGAAHGVTPELTFNIFGANLAGRAEKQMKGSIEVIKVIDANTSLCRITSLYDSEGLSIPLNMQTRGRLLRESDAALREGDLLFNLFWGTRVAIAGYVNITGDASSPAEQFRQMEDFMYLLKRNGMTVDAYVDLRDGKIQGAISPKTRYLIFGDDLRAPGEKPAPAPKKPDDDKDKEKDKEKEPVAKEVQQPNLDRNDAVNRSSILLRKDAIERGLLLISAENFATVIGYRKARSANMADESKFRPTLPYVSSAPAGVIVVPERPKEEEKKADPEKKDGN